MGSLEAQGSSNGQRDYEAQNAIVWNQTWSLRVIPQPLDFHSVFPSNVQVFALVPEKAKTDASGHEFVHDGKTMLMNQVPSNSVSHETVLCTMIEPQPTVRSVMVPVPTTATSNITIHQPMLPIPTAPANFATHKSMLPHVPYLKQPEVTANLLHLGRPKCFCQIIPSEQLEILAKRLYFKQLRTLYYWFKKETRKEQLLLEVEILWKQLPEDQRMFYFSQVVEKLSKDLNSVDPRILSQQQRRQLEYLRTEGRPSFWANTTAFGSPRSRSRFSEPPPYCSSCCTPGPRVNPDLARMIGFKIPTCSLPTDPRSTQPSTDTEFTTANFLKAKRELTKRQRQPRERKPKEPKPLKAPKPPKVPKPPKAPKAPKVPKPPRVPKPKAPKVPKPPRVPKVPKVPKPLKEKVPKIPKVKVPKPASKSPVAANLKRARISDVEQEINVPVSKKRKCLKSPGIAPPEIPSPVPMTFPRKRLITFEPIEIQPTPPRLKAAVSRRSVSVASASVPEVPPAKLHTQSKPMSELPGPECNGKMESAVLQSPVVNYVFQWSHDGSMVLTDKIMLPGADKVSWTLLEAENIQEGNPDEGKSECTQKEQPTPGFEQMESEQAPEVINSWVDMDSLLTGLDTNQVAMDEEVDAKQEQGLARLLACSESEEEKMFRWLIGRGTWDTETQSKC